MSGIPAQANAILSENPGRFAFVDALRGLAAALVAGYHLYGGISGHFSRQTFVQPFHSLLAHGNAGVEIFFVISGFVIACSMRKAWMTPRYFCCFVLRRSLRLDPPYWATILLALAVLVVANQVRPDRVLPVPSGWHFLLHGLYLQNIAGVGSFVEVFWTLCLEVQFYLAFALLLGVAQLLGGPGLHGFAAPRILFMAFLPITVVSLAIQFGWASSPCPGLMLRFWYLFQLGALVFWALNGTLGTMVFAGYLVLLAMLLGTCNFTIECLVGVLTGLCIYFVGRLGGLETWLNHWPFQYLGRISYSFYLVHTVVGCPFVYFLKDRLAGPEPGFVLSFLLFVMGAGVSVGVADLFHRWIERPSISWSKRVSLPHGGVGEKPPTQVALPEMARAA